MGVLRMLLCKLLHKYMNSNQLHVLVALGPLEQRVDFGKGNMGSMLAGKDPHLALFSTISGDFYR